MEDKYRNKKGLPPNTGSDIRMMILHTFSFGYIALVVQSILRVENVQNELAFYWLYHSHPYNQLVHFVFVPLLMWTVLICMAHVEVASTSISLPFIPTHTVNCATISTILLSLLYTKIDMIGGALYLPVLYLLYGSAVRLHERDQRHSNFKSWIGTGKLFQWPIVLHVLGWALQILSHAYFEQGRPALLDSFGQALTIAPLFAFYECLWFLGINKPLQQLVMENVAIAADDFCATGVSAHVCEVLSTS